MNSEFLGSQAVFCLATTKESRAEKIHFFPKNVHYDYRLKLVGFKLGLRVCNYYKATPAKARKVTHVDELIPYTLLFYPIPISSPIILRKEISTAAGHLAPCITKKPFPW